MYTLAAERATADNQRRARLLLSGALALYGIPCLLRPDAGRILDAVDVAIHETGHLVFAPFGEFLQFLGGILFQLALPAAFVAYFWRRDDRHAASVALWWVAQNCWNISVYVRDARTQALPLVGGAEHDWAYLLGRLGWLPYAEALALDIWVVGVAIYGYALVLGIRAATCGCAFGPWFGERGPAGIELDRREGRRRRAGANRDQARDRRPCAHQSRSSEGYRACARAWSGRRR